MKLWIPKFLLALAATIFALGGALHAAAYFSKASQVIGAANLDTFFAQSLKVLWLADSTTLVTLALVFALIAVKPASVSKPIILLLALIPGATTALLYWFLGPFYAAHMLMVGTAMVFIAGLMLRTDRGAQTSSPQMQQMAAGPGERFLSTARPAARS